MQLLHRFGAAGIDNGGNVTEQMERSGKDRRADYCGSHDERCQMHRDLAKDVYIVRDEVMSVRSERKTEKAFYGLIGTVILFAMGLFGWMFKDNLEQIRLDLGTIKISVSGTTNTIAGNRAEIDGMKGRLTAIEDELVRHRK